MIKRFSDHAANERTYLAWIRTALALMAFGFLIEKFDLFFRMITKAMKVTVNMHYSHLAEIIGISMMIVSVLVIVGASSRYVYNRKQILVDEEKPYGSRTLDLVLAGLLIIVSIFLVVYISVTLFD